MGTRAGVPDLMFVHNDTRIAFIELKRRDGRLNEAQRWFLSWCAERAIPHLLIRSDDTIFIIRETEVFLTKYTFLS